MEEDSVLKRISESNLFTTEEINMIIENIILYEKCYLLGVLDAQ